MWPTLVSLGPVYIHTFGIFIFFGVFFGAFKLWRRAKEEGWEETAVIDIWLLSGVMALVAGRLGYAYWHGLEAGLDWYKIMFFTKYPGLSGEAAWWGGTITLLVLALKKKLSFWHFFEIAASALIIAELMVRIGGFFAGTSLGRPAPAGWGLSFPGVSDPRWPVQLFWAVGLGGVYLAFNWLEKHYRSFGWSKEGFLAAAYLGLTGVLGLGLGWFEARPNFWGAGARLAIGGLILLVRSGIKIKAPVFTRKPAVKKTKRRFDYA